jgi:N-acetyl-anhydromuramyl-L-alanine amidase AmpD
MLRARTILAVAALLAPLACSSLEGHPSHDREPTGSLESALMTSAEKANVPRDLLVAIAKVEEGLTHPKLRAEIDVDNEVPAAGPLQLRRGKLDTLRRGAELVGASEIDLRKDADLALEAGALVLAELGAKTGARLDDLASWSHAVEEMGGFADEAHRKRYVHQVFATLARGGSFPARDGETIVLPPHDLPPSLTIDVSQALSPLAEAQYEGAEWFPTSCTNKCTEGRGGFEVELIVIHDTEGSWTASVATLQNDPDKSAHYIIDVDGKVGQFVTEETTAWHAGNFNVNQRSIGVEHVGYATKPFPEPLYASSAKLVDHLAKKYGIPRDRAHIIGHDQVPNGKRIGQTAPPCSDSPKECQASPDYGGASNHTDPGIWEWPTYMIRFGGEAKCNDATELWSCSNDKTKAFRCAGGKVEVVRCEGACQVSPDGHDDLCKIAPKSAPPPSGSLAISSPRVREEEGGCAVGAVSQAHTGACLLALVAAATALRARRCRRPQA